LKLIDILKLYLHKAAVIKPSVYFSLRLAGAFNDEISIQ
jgi:hypothetical protein